MSPFRTLMVWVTIMLVAIGNIYNTMAIRDLHERLQAVERMALGWPNHPRGGVLP